MIITGTIVIIVTLVASAVTGTAGVAGGYYWGSSKEDRKHKKALKKLKEEQHLRQRELHQSTHTLVTNTDSQIITVTNHTAAIQQQINSDTSNLNKEIKIARGVNLQLLSVNDLLKLASESIGRDMQPLIKELQRRLDELTSTNLELATAKTRLNQTVLQLQETVTQHAVIKDKLEVNIGESKKKIDGLTVKLNDAASLMQNSYDAKDKKITSLEVKCSELASQLSTALKMNKALRSENKALTQIIDSLSKALEVYEPQEKQEQPTHNAPKLRMFGT